jgi:hypothetical protein
MMRERESEWVYRDVHTQASKYTYKDTYLLQHAISTSLLRNILQHGGAILTPLSE